MVDPLGEGQTKSEVKVTQVSSENQDKELGSSVDDIPLIDLSTSSKESLNKEGQGEIVSKPFDSSVSKKEADPMSSEGEVSSEGDVSLGVESVNEEQEQGKETGKVDRLERLAKQIDDFDPSPIFERKVVPGGVEFTGDINDDNLVDKLLEEAEGDDDKSKVTLDKDKTGKGEVTPCEADKTGDEGKEESPAESTDEGELDESSNNEVSNVDTPENGEESQQNGNMSASTESDGFQEEKTNGENNNTDKANVANKSGQNKQDSQKSETASPTKTAKSKKKEDKSIGKSAKIIIIL